tara:strand:- start:40 stop:204 length:165 start_codon:yes stop_codon:yes gene_type:complete
MRVHIPNKENKLIDQVLTELYLMRTAIFNEKPEQLIKRINKIRQDLLKIKDDNI